MTYLTMKNSENAPEAARPILAAVQDKVGFVPNLFGVFANAPALLKGYTALSGIFDETGFSPEERQVILLSVSYVNGCDYCMAAHSMTAPMAGLPEDVLSAIREGREINDPKLQALRAFAQHVVRKQGWLDDGDITAFLDAGYSEENILEVILGVAVKTMSNYANHVAQTPLDEPFQKVAWEKPKSEAAE